MPASIEPEQTRRRRWLHRWRWSGHGFRVHWRASRWFGGRWLRKHGLRPERRPPTIDDAASQQRQTWTARLWISFVIIVVLSFQATSVWMYAVLFTYALTVLVMSRTMVVHEEEGTASSLHLFIEVVVLTIALAAMDELQGPLVGLYGILVLIGGLIGGRRRAVSAGIFAALAYGVGLTLDNQIPLPWFSQITHPAIPGSEVPEIGRSFVLGCALLAAMVFAAATFIDQARLRAMRAERLYRGLFNAAHEPIVIWHPKTTEILDLNPAAVHLAGMRREDLIGREGISLLPPPDQELARLLLNDYPEAGQTLHRFVRPDQEERILAAAPVFLDSPRAGVSVIKDLTDAIRRSEEQQRYAENLEREVEIRTRDLEQSNRELERSNQLQQGLHEKLRSRTEDLERVNQKLRDTHLQLVDAQRLRVVEDLAGAVAHTVNNPLQALLGTVELAIESASGDKQTLERIWNLGKRIQRVVQSTLELIRRGEMDLRREEPGEILTALYDECMTRAARQGVKVSKFIEPKLPPLVVDRTLILSALTSVAENALEAMKGGGALELEVEQVADVDAVRFRISDTGPGFSDKVQHKVLEPFFTTKGGGTGLGLAIAHGIVLGHQGKLSISNGSTGGACVSIELPCDVTSSPEWRILAARPDPCTQPNAHESEGSVVLAEFPAED